jgi:hypothetical protein
MNPDNLGPPEKERPSGYQAARPDQELADHTTNAQNSTADGLLCARHAPQDYLSQIRRRNAAARRMPPLEHSGRRDPLTARERADGWQR